MADSADNFKRTASGNSFPTAAQQQHRLVVTREEAGSGAVKAQV